MNLYELTSEQLYINQLLEENGGELTEELMSLMEVNETNFNDKIEGYCKAIKIMESNHFSCLSFFYCRNYFLL